MVPLIKHNNYSKISDIIYWINRDWILRFNVELYKKVNNERINYHSEFQYMINGKPYTSISRSFNYYISIDASKSDEENNRASLRIYQNDIYFVKQAFNQVHRWFTDPEYKSLFVKTDDGSVTFGMNINSIKVGLTFNTYLEIEPAVSMNNSEYEIGVHFYLGSDQYRIFIPLRIFFIIYDIITQFNMYQAACTLVNYIERPDIEPVNNMTNANNKQKPKFLDQSKNKTRG